jgi:hypothetical protein
MLLHMPEKIENPRIQTRRQREARMEIHTIAPESRPVAITVE